MDDNEGNLREMNQVLRKIIMCSCAYWTFMQLNVLKVCFHLEVGLVFITDLSNC